MGRRIKERNKKKPMSIALPDSLIRNIKLLSELRGTNISNYVRELIEKNLPEKYNFPQDENIYNLPFIGADLKNVLRIWVSQLNLPDLKIEDNKIFYKNRTLEIDDISEVLTSQSSIKLKEDLFDLIHPEGLESGLLNKDSLRNILSERGIEDGYAIISDPAEDYYFIVPERGSKIEKVIEVKRTLSLEEVEKLIEERTL